MMKIIFALVLVAFYCHITEQAIGINCGTNPQICANITNGDCRQGICACKDNYTVDIFNNSNCLLKPAKFGDSCQNTDQCNHTLTNSVCTQSRCACNPPYVANTTLNQCLRANATNTTGSASLAFATMSTILFCAVGAML